LLAGLSIDYKIEKTMESISKSGGLSARRRATDKENFPVPCTSDRIKRATICLFIAGILLTLSSCHEKTNEQNSNEQRKSHAALTQDSLSRPQINIKVDKHYDKKGNLTGFDSTYTSFYSNVRGDTVQMDSLMNSFDLYFNRNHSSFFDKQFNTLFFNDSLRYPDFFHRDFFLRRYELNDPYLRGMMQRMDSIKNKFYHDRSQSHRNSKDL
jgi:hypothetical protein